eukprot:TRINITY_DN35434_c0_g1_i1.p1 TRINITY_DN35434_c0_g1~~TRINITY_DN35434_c0_g1_i1.p1  ORF type:complete len:823 (+),score=116.58 TRINITY_DN35434_c0_g1_i1:147-2471(+)
MSLSPDFGHALCDRIVTMWHSMGRPTRLVIAEFGGGTGMLARDILRRAKEYHQEFYEAVARYVIAERSQAMRTTQGKTAAEFVSSGKLVVVRADGRQAASVRSTFEEVVGTGQRITGIILSNELLDEFDPVRLRLMWRKTKPPSPKRCQECSSYREAHVVHVVDKAALESLVLHPAGNGLLGSSSLEEVEWESQSLFCGLLRTPALRQAIEAVTEDLTPAEHSQCLPMAICCTAFVFAVDQALQYHYEALDPAEVKHRSKEDGLRELVRLYRSQVQATNNTVLLSKERYRQLRRIASARGSQVERALLVGNAPHLVPGRIWSREVMLALSPSRCEELRGWMARHAVRLSTAAQLRDVSAPAYDGDPSSLRTAVHLKLVVRPGEATFTDQTSQALDEGFLVTFDYGADADALIWQALIRPNYEGIQIVDARDELQEECTSVSYLECPGLQDLTTSVDFTEVALAGKELGDWEVKAYGPIFLMELSFDLTHLRLAERDDPFGLGHLLERAGSLHSPGLQAWYRVPEQDPWASFKVLVQHKGSRGLDWTIGPLGRQWPLGEGAPRLFRGPSPCWRRDLTKPPFASLITTATHHELGDDAWGSYHSEASSAPSAMDAHWVVNKESSAESTIEEKQQIIEVMSEQFLAVLLGSGQPVDDLLDYQHLSQRQAYADMHLAVLLVDYWRILQVHGPSQEPQVMESYLAQLSKIANSRQLPELYGDVVFQRVLKSLTQHVFIQNVTGALPDSEAYPAFVCLGAKALHGNCLGGLCNERIKTAM